MESLKEEMPSEVLTPETDNATYFDPEDAASSQTNYKRLRLYNRNTWKDRREENKEVTHRRDNLAIFDALAGQLELTPYQKSEARRVYDNLDLGEIGKSVRLVAFGVCVVIANEDVDRGCRYHPDMENPDDKFQWIASDLNFSKSEIYSIIGIVRWERNQ